MAKLIAYLDPLSETEKDFAEKEAIKLFKEQKKSAYELLLPKNESMFMGYLRSWERRVGFVTPLIYWNVFLLTALHSVSIFWCGYYLYQGQAFKWKTLAFVFFMMFLSGFGVGGGVHRLWSHRSYKATLPLRAILLFLYTIAGQNSVYDWVRNHRAHHKGSDTASDPHDCSRGMFFAHCGWLMMMRHPRVVEECSKVDMSDIENDPLLRFHTKYFPLLRIVFCFGLPSVIPALLWEETWGMAVLSQALLRYLIVLHATWSVNSIAHKFGTKPYNGNINPVDNELVSMVSFGEGWHNYHHSFPWDYKAAELPYNLSPTTRLLDLFASVGWAYDLKSASPDLIRKYILNHRGGKLS